METGVFQLPMTYMRMLNPLDGSAAPLSSHSKDIGALEVIYYDCFANQLWLAEPSKRFQNLQLVKYHNSIISESFLCHESVKPCVLVCLKFWEMKAHNPHHVYM